MVVKYTLSTTSVVDGGNGHQYYRGSAARILAWANIKMKTNTDPRPALLAKIRSQLMRAKDRRAALNEIKTDLSLELVAPFLRSLAQYPYFRNIYAADAAPKTYSDLRRAHLLKRSTFERELTWTLSVLQNFEGALSEFVDLERRFVDAWMLGQFAAAGDILSEVDQRFGKSGWLIERRLALLQEVAGLDAQKAYSFEIRRDDSASVWSKFYAFNYSMRMEPTVSSASYIRMVEGQVSKAEQEDFRAYLACRLVPVPSIPRASLAGILGWDENAPIIDRYLNFLKLAQYLCASAVQHGQRDELRSLLLALEQSALSVTDYRLANIRFALGNGNLCSPPTPCSTTLSVFDDYAMGKYDRALSTARALLEQHASRADLYEIFVKSSLQLKRSSDGWPKHSPLARLFHAYENIVVRTSQYVESVDALQKLGLVINDSAISAHISHLLGREKLRDEFASATEVAANIAAPVGNPWQLTAFNALSADSTGGVRLFEQHRSSPSLRLQAAINIKDDDCDAILAQPIFSEVPDYRRDFYSARILERFGRLPEAAELYERWLGSAYPPLYFDSVLRLTWARFLTKAYDEVLQLIVRTYLRSPFAYASMPVAEVLAAVQADDPSKFAKSPALAIVHDIYFKHIATNLDGERSDAFEDYLASVSIARPSQLREILAGTSGTVRDILIHYLRYICIPRIMDHYTEFDGTTDLLTERIAICQLLAEVDVANDTAYTDEIRSTTQELVVSEGVRQIEQSRIYVDTDSIREHIEKSFSESYARYVQLPVGVAGGSNRRIILQEIGEVVSDSKRGVLYVPLDERTAFLNSLVEHFGAQFVMNSRHGLSAYLSGRIRHGILPNHLRSPLQVAQLATLKDSKTGTYRPNEYWSKQLSALSPEVRTQLGVRLASFTKNIDELIDLVNQKWIQIKRPNAPEGLFDFMYSPQDLVGLEARVQATQGYDEFIDLLFQFFWNFTEGSLAIVRQRLDDDLKPKIVNAFDELETDLSGLLSGANFPELDAAITKARTEMLGTLEAVKGWFRLSKAADKPDFDLSTLIEIAIRSTNNIFKFSQLSPHINLRTSMRLKGRSLTNLVELLCLLLSNIVLRSGVIGRAPHVELDVCAASDGWLRFSIVNEVAFASEKDREEAEKSIAEVKELMARNDPTSLLDRNRGTGYGRVQKILTHDLKCQHRIEFNLTSIDKFTVAIELDSANLRVPL